MQLGLLEQNDRPDGIPESADTRKSTLGQFMTPSGVAKFMASLFPPTVSGVCRLLDAGAGMGALSSAFLDRCIAGELRFSKVELTAYEIDPGMRYRLAQALEAYRGRQPMTSKINEADFIEDAADRLLSDKRYFTHAILNPPYKKINAKSAHRLKLRTVGIETVNLYTAFVALAVGLSKPGAHIVAIIPRSFCNGPYYRQFREFVLRRCAIRRMHLFESRSKAFKDDDVLQENVIIHLERDREQGPVTVSTSTDATFADMAMHEHPFDRIVFTNDDERFIHVPTTPEVCAIETATSVNCSLEDLGIKVSTGPVVDFRLREHLRNDPTPTSVPLLYPGHFAATGVDWPKLGMKKPNAIERNAETEKWLYPMGSYCVVRRFSSKEERRRIVATVVEPGSFPKFDVIGLENHLNVFHEDRHGLPEGLAAGLAAFLNTTAVDEAFRRFNGHTQVNATDLKQMKYPGRDALLELGKWASSKCALSQEDLDKHFEKLMYERQRK